MTPADRLRLPASLPNPVRYCIYFYLSHLLCLGWIGSSEIFLGLSLICAIVAIRKRQLVIRWHPLYFPLLAYLIASTISTCVNPNPWRSYPELGEWFAFTTFPLALALYRRVPRLFPLALRALTILAIFLSCYGLYQYFLLGYNKQELAKRITGSLSHVMTYSGIVLPLSLLFLILALRWKRPATLTATVLSFVALVLTFTRGAWLGWISGFTMIALRRKPRLLAFAAPVLTLAIVFSPLAIFARMVSSFDISQSSNVDRIRMVEAGIEMIKDYPLFGVGPTNVKEIYPFYRKPDAPRFRIPHLHNNVVQIWAERGIIALAAYAMLVYLFIGQCLVVPRGRKVARMFADAGLSIAVALALAGLFEFNFGDTEVLLTMLDLFALISAGIERFGRSAASLPSPAQS